MRLHVHLDDDLVAELDRLVGERGRSAYIEDAVRDRIDRARRWDKIWAAAGSIGDEGHPWDPDPSAYIHAERVRQTRARNDARR
jgi:hypothetical protein